MTASAAAVKIRTRRFGHANLFIEKGSLERSAKFYRDVVGLEEVRREPDLDAILFSTGQTHHDIAVIEASGEERVGLDGQVQIPKGRGKQAGLNHFGWETETEALLVDAYRRACDANVNIHRIVDHQIAHSLYIFDPDGNLNEWYADVTKDWRTVLNPSRTDLVTSTWHIEESTPIAEPRYHANPQVAVVPDAVFQPVRINHAVMITNSFDRMVDHYSNIGGLTAQVFNHGTRYAELRGAASSLDLVLVEASGAERPGLHHLAFRLPSESAMDRSLQRLKETGTDAILTVDNPHKHSVFVTDPNGFTLEFFSRRSNRNDAPNLGKDQTLPFFV